MSDIMERLRLYPATTREEAVAEIERLRAENEALRALLLDGKRIAERTINESLGIGDHQEMLDDWIARIDAALEGK